jgi:pyruvate,water dikinase
MAQTIAKDRILYNEFLNHSATRLADDLPQEIRMDLNKFLTRYGCRSRHRTLFIKRWNESPEEVLGILQSLVRNHIEAADVSTDQRMARPETTNPSACKLQNKENATSLRGDPSRTADGGLSPARLILPAITRVARRFLDLREDLRFTLDRILYLIRKSLLTLGEQTGLDDKIMFLNGDELNELVRGNLSHKEAGRRAFQRYGEFMQPFDGATFYNQGLAENEFHSDGTRIMGIGTSPGRVTGRAKIVDDPARSDIRRGDILVAKNTDPGWTPILSIVGGMVMEEGGLLNHCSIVARELGVPSIVAVHGATQRIEENARITIDGGMGVIVIED